MATVKSKPIPSAKALKNKPAPNAKAALKTATTSPVKPAAKPAGRPTAPVAVKAMKAVKTIKPPKPKKDKLVRDSFTIPKSEHLVIDALKQRAVKLGSPAKRSELMRAGIKALAGMADGAFADALKNVPAIKTGRPSKG